MRRNGFTLVELLVVLAIVGMLLALSVVSLRGTHETQRQMQALIAARTKGQAIDVYCSDYGGTYPSGFVRGKATHPPKPSSVFWIHELIERGYFTRMSDEELGGVTYWSLTLTVQAAPSYFVRDAVLDKQQIPVRGVTRSDVVFASLKGLLSPQQVPDGGKLVFWCCTRRTPSAPVAMCDGSVVVGSYPEFAGGADEIFTRLGFGVPVYSTWGGYLGRDR